MNGQVDFRHLVMMALFAWVIWLLYQRMKSLSKRLDDLRDHTDSRITSMGESIRSEIPRLEDQIERLEHPVVRP